MVRPSFRETVWHRSVDGQSVEAIYHPGTFSGNWPSTGAVSILAELAGHTLDLTVSVQNTGDTPMPVGIGWMPYFNIASNDRASATLTIPSTTRLECDRNTDVPTGRMVSVGGTSLDLSLARGTQLDKLGLNETYVHLINGVLGSGPVAEFRDTAFGYGIRVLPLSANIRALHVLAPADKPWVSITPETNYDDALGAEWDTSEGSGIKTLQPGDTLQYKVRLELFTFTAGLRRGSM